MGDYEFQFIDKNEFKGIVQKVLDRRRKEREKQILQEFESCKTEMLDKLHLRDIEIDPIEIETYRQSLDINSEQSKRTAESSCIVWKASSDRTEFSAKSKSGLKILCENESCIPQHRNIEIHSVRDGGDDVKVQMWQNSGHDVSKDVDNIEGKPSEGLEFSVSKTSSVTNYPDVGMIFIRITSFQRVITAAVDQIIPKLLEKKFFDGPKDYEKCQKRYVAFVSLLSRNYLYRIERIISDIETTDLEIISETEAIALIMKICTLYNTIEFSIQAFLKNLSNFVADGVPEKIPVFLKLIKTATELCISKGYFDHTDNIATALVDKVRLLLQKLNEYDKATRMKRKALRSRYELEYKLEKTWSMSNLSSRNKTNLSMYAETVRPVKKPERRRRSKAAVSSFQRPHVIQNLKKSIGFAQKQDHTGKMENSTDASNTNADGVQNNNETQNDDDLSNTLLSLRLDYVQSAVEKEQLRMKYENQCEQLGETQANHILNEIVSVFEH